MSRGLRPYNQILPIVKSWAESSDYFRTPKPLYQFAVDVQHLLCQSDINDKIVDMLTKDLSLVIFLHNRTNYLMPFADIAPDLIDWIAVWPQPNIKRCPVSIAANKASAFLGRTITPIQAAQAAAAVGLKMTVGECGIQFIAKIRNPVAGGKFYFNGGNASVH